ncbi:MAG: hypothetical protein AABY32_02605 [Nanoarchaeota archaeon]
MNDDFMNDDFMNDDFMNDPKGVMEAEAVAEFWRKWKEENPNRLSLDDDYIIGCYRRI